MSSPDPEPRRGRPWRETGVDLLLVAGAAALLMLPSLLFGAPAGHDYHQQVVWIEAFTDRLMAGDLYPRWLGALWAGAGGPDFFFYPPLPYWISGALRAALCPGCGADRILVLSGLFWLALSGMTFRPLARRFVGRWSALAGAVVYMALPYHLGADWHDRVAHAEFAAAALLPLHLAAFLDCLAGRAAGPRLALWTAAILLCHLPTALIVASACLVLFVVVARAGGWRVPLRLGLAAVVGLGAAALYWLPAVTLLESVSSALMTEGLYHWSRSFLTTEMMDCTPFFRGLWPPFAGLSAAAILCVALLGRVAPGVRPVVLALIALVAFMVTPLARLFYEFTPLGWIQFAWRYLMLADLAFALAAAVAAQAALQSTAPEAGARMSRGIGLAALAAMAGVAAFEHPGLRASRNMNPVPALEMRLSAGAIEWLPREAFDLLTSGETAPFEALPAIPRVRATPAVPGVEAARLSASPRAETYRVDLLAPARVTFKRTYWRHARLVEAGTGRAIPTRASDGFPLTEAELPAGRGRYVLELPTLAVERAGAAFSAAGLAALLIWWAATRLRGAARGVSASRTRS